MFKKLLLVTLGAIAFQGVEAKQKKPSLHEACNGYESYLVEILIESGSNCNEIDSKGQTPLFQPCKFYWHFDLAVNFAKQLLEAGTYVNHCDKRGNTPLHIACNCSFKNDKLILLLINNGANPHIKNNDGNTPLHLAAKEKCIWYLSNTVKNLVSVGAKVNEKNNLGQTPLHIASAYGRNQVLKCLLSYGADIYAVDKNGNTPADICCSQFDNEKAAEKRFEILGLLQN